MSRTLVTLPMISGLPGFTKNYFSLSNLNGDFESGSVLPWSACTITYSGGQPSTFTSSATSMSIAINSSAPLSGTYDVFLTKASANAQYQGFYSGVITVDTEDLGKPLFGSFSYKTSGANFDASGTSTQSLEIWVYDVSNNAWIQPWGYRGMNSSGGNAPGKCNYGFQANVLGNQYRIFIFTAQTSALAYAVEFDSFSLGPQALVNGAACTDWQSYTLTIGATTTAPTPGTSASLAKWRRIGDSMEISYYFNQTSAGSAGSGTYLFPLPPGYSIDTTKATVSINGINATQASILGFGNISNTNTSNSAIAFFGPVIGYNSNNLTLFANGGTNQAEAPVTSSSFALSGSIINYAFNVTVPIAGWSSNVQMSTDTDTRVVSWEGYTSSTQSAASGGTQITSWNTIDDTHGAFNTSNSSYVVPVSGYYNIEGSFGYSAASANNQSYCYIYKNGALLSNGPQNNQTTSQPGCVTFNNSFKLVANDVITFYAYCQNTTALNAGSATGPGRWSIFRLSGPSVVASTESVNCRYTNSGTQSVTSGNNLVTFFNTKTYDTHGAFNTTTGVFTAPISGKYSVKSFLQFSGTLSTSQGPSIQLFKNGSLYSFLGGVSGNGTQSTYYFWGSDDVQLMAGETCQINYLSSISGSLSSNGYLSISRNGN